MFKSIAGGDDDIIIPPKKKKVVEDEKKEKKKKKEEEVEGEEEEIHQKEEGRATLKIEVKEKKKPEATPVKKNLYIERNTPSGSCGPSCPITIKFSLPIVPLGMIGDHKVPNIEITPPHPKGGKWIWESCDLLKFLPEGEWDRGRSYNVKMKKEELKTHEGVKLNNDINFNFNTRNINPSSIFPPKWVKVENPLLILHYYYPVDAEAAFKRMKVCDRRDESKTYPIEFVTLQEAKEKYFSDPNFHQYVADIGRENEFSEARYHRNGVWFRINAKLQPGTSYEVRIDDRTLTFETIGEFKLNNFYPNENRRIDKRTTQFSFNFSNPLRPDNLVVEIDPDFPQFSVWEKFSNQYHHHKRLEVIRDRISLKGRTKGDVKYTFQFKNVEDVFGNKLPDFSKELHVKPLHGRVRIGYDYYTNVVDTTPPMKKYYFSMMTLNVKNVDFEVYHLDDFDQSQRYQNPEQYDFKPVHKSVVETNAPLDSWHEVNVPIKWEYLQRKKEKLGHIVVRVRANEWMTDSRSDDGVRTFWFQFTRICLSVYQFPMSETLVCVNGFDGKIHTSGVEFFHLSSDPKKKDEPIPVVREGPLFRIPSQTELKGLICRTKSGDSCCLRDARHNTGRSSDWKAAYLFTDRHVYQPGEMVSMKGILRKITFPPDSKVYVVKYPEHESEFTWKLTDNRGQKLEEGKTKFTNKNGSFHFQFKIPETVPHGRCNFRMDYQGQTFNTMFKVMEFRTPKFFVGVKDVTEKFEKPYILGDRNVDVKLQVSAHYFDDKSTPIEGGQAKWQFRSISGFHKSFSPVRGGYYSFYMKNVPKQDYYDHDEYWDDGVSWRNLTTGKTNKEGEHTIKFNPKKHVGGYSVCYGDDWVLKKEKEKKPKKGEESKPKRVQLPRPNNISQRYVINSSVSDLNQQTVSSTHTVTFYVSKKFVGVKYDQVRFKGGTEYLPFHICVCDHVGNELGGEKVRVVVVDQQDKDIILMDRIFMSDRKKNISLGQYKLDLPLENMKEYKIYAELVSEDEKKIVNWCGSNFWCDDSLFGGDTGLDKIEMLSLKMIANQNEYNRGEEAKILIQCPFDEKDNKDGCSGVIVSQSARIVNVQSFKIDVKKKKNQSETVLSVPLNDDCIPNIAVHCFLYGRKFSPKYGRVLTSYAKGTIDVKMNIHSVRGFEVRIELDNSTKKYTPGKEGWVRVFLKKKKEEDPELEDECMATVIIVDESILSLIGKEDSNYKIQNPLEKFYRAQSLSNFTHHDLRQKIFLKKVEDGDDDEEKENDDGDDDDECEEEEMMDCCMESCGGGQMQMQMQKKQMSSPRGGGGSGSVSIRSNFTPLALFSPEAPLDPKKLSTSKIPFKLPDQITQFHVFAMVSQEQEFGLAEDMLATDLDVTLQLGSFPFVLHLGDLVHFSVLVFNKTSKMKNLTIECRVNEEVVMLKKCKVEKKVKGKERIEVIFGPVEAKEISKGNRVLVSVYDTNTKSYYDAIEKLLPVKFPISDETFAQYGEIKAEEEVCPIPLSIPSRSKVVPSHGGLKIELSSTILQTLQDAHSYLVYYPFLCSEQVTSKVLAVVSVDPISKAFNFPAQPSKIGIRRMISSCIKKYKSCQKGDGGFGYWSSRNRSYMYVSLYIMYCMTHLKHYKLVQNLSENNVFEAVFRKAGDYLMKVVRARPGRDPKKDSNVLNLETTYLASQIYLKSFAIHILVLLDRFKIHPGYHSHEKLAEIVLPELRDLVEEARRLPSSLIASSKAYVAQAYCHFKNPLQAEKKEIPGEAEELLNMLNNSVEEIAGRAVFVTRQPSWDGSYVFLHSDAKMNATVFSVLLDMYQDAIFPPSHPLRILLPKLGKGVVGSRAAGMGRWRNTQENVCVLISLRRYFDLFEKEEPNFKVSWSVGEKLSSEEPIVFKGRETEVKGSEIKMPSLLDSFKEGDDDEETEGEIVEKEGEIACEVKLEKTGLGMLYYRVGLTYARNKRFLDAMDRGFFIKRSFHCISGKLLGKKDLEDHVEYTFKRGSVVRVKIHVMTKIPRYHVVLTDPLPAGGDIITPQLQLSEKISSDVDLLNSDYWIVQKNYKKERMELFTRPILREGKYYFSYEFKAMNSGKFLTPPVKIWEMYSDDVFGRSKTDVVVIN